MKKQIERRLSLSKETLRNLSERELGGVFGGGPTQTCCNSCSDGCPGPTSSCQSDICTDVSLCC